jgi:hypothetical protein
MKELEFKSVDGKKVASKHPGYFASMEVLTVEGAQTMAAEEGWSGDEFEDTCAACNGSNAEVAQDEAENVDSDVAGVDAIALADLNLKDLVDPDLEAENQRILSDLDEVS